MKSENWLFASKWCPSLIYNIHFNIICILFSLQPVYLTLLFSALLAATLGEPQIGKASPYHYQLPLKSSKQVAFTRSPNNKQKTLVVQIRSDQPVPLVLKGRHNIAHAHGHSHVQTHAHALAHSHGHSHVHHHINAASNNHNHVRAHPRPIKLSAPMYLKNPALMRKPLKLKLTSSKVKHYNLHKPATSYDVPFKYEKPISYASSELVQQLPVCTEISNLISQRQCHNNNSLMWQIYI